MEATTKPTVEELEREFEELLDKEVFEPPPVPFKGSAKSSSSRRCSNGNR